MYIELSKKEYKMLKKLKRKSKSRSQLCRKSGSVTRLTHLLELNFVVSDFDGYATREALFSLTDSGRTYLQDYKDEYMDDQIHELVFSILLPIILSIVASAITSRIMYLYFQ